MKTIENFAVFMGVSAPLTRTPFNFPNYYFQAAIKI